MSKSNNIFSLIFSKKTLLHLVLIAVVSAGIIFGALKYLDHFTQHGNEITVPDLVGIEKKELKEFLKEKDLHFKIIDSSFSLEAEKGVVLAQNPKPMSKVKKERTIYVTISSAQPPSVKLPMLTDKSMRQAKSMIENAGLFLGELIFIPDLCVNCVLAQKVGGVEVLNDTIVPKGTTVDLVLGRGLSDEKILVPLLVNLTRKEAIEKLKLSYLNLGAELYDGSVFDDEDSLAAKIFVQHPPYSAKSWVRMGSSVDVQYTMLKNKIDTSIVILDSSLFPQIEKDS